MNKVRTRFAPSPTGYLHIGGARTALFNWLFARKMGGTFILRIEDTDHARNTEAATQAIFDGMEWLGLDWDEGPMKGGDYGPYFQSQRDEIYDAYFKKLQDLGRVYEQDGAWRFRFDRSKPVTYDDIICGPITIDYRDASNTPDMAIKRSDGSYVFHFVNVVDDIEMKMTHVIRGEDHIMNTPKHIQLFEALGVTPPIYGHIPLILNPDGSKMSKRDIGAALGTYPQEGFLAEGVMNFLALLGWSPKDDTEIFTPAQLVDRFSLEAINRAPAKFDIVKCTWVNQQHIATLSADDFVARALPFCIADGLPENSPILKEAIATVQSKVQTLAEVPEKISFFFTLRMDDEALAKIQPGAGAHMAALAEALSKMDSWDGHLAVDTLKDTAKARGLKKVGAVMFPARVALTGVHGGPDLSDIFALLGRDESIKRLTQAANTWE
ncbi:MAG: glutamate--tRNA ligase family protein [Akkermansia sp.]